MQERIFITLGSQKFHFNRLLREVDTLYQKGVLSEPAFAQIGHSDYHPRYYPYKDFLDREQFERELSRADIVITHGGTGAIVGALKQGKKVIAVARRAKYGEHVDDHQLQIIKQFNELNMICGIWDLSRLEWALQYVREHEFAPYISNTEKILQSIDEFIKENFCD